MKPCPECGKEVPDHALICKYCGEKFDEMGQAEPMIERGTKRRSVNAIGVVLLVFLGLSIVMLIYTVGLSMQQRSSSVAVPTVELPTATPMIGNVPGLLPGDVKVNLMDRGFECGDIRYFEDGTYGWTCTREEAYIKMIVDIYSREIMSVDLINAQILQFYDPKDDLATTFLGFMATMPYDNATPDEARQWVKDTIPILKGQGDVHEKYFSGVKYELFGIETARYLVIGNLP